jgi:apolipoprotein D and lipocalin family protein
MKYRATIFLFCSLLAGCQSVPDKPIPTVAHVDLQRFMGDWYVIANIPTFIEVGAHNAVESYELLDKTTVKTTFKFNQDSFDGPLKAYHPTGYIVDTKSNAHWDMQFFWPFKSEYRIVYLDENYQHTIIGRTKRDYLWIMSRSPDIEQSIYIDLVAKAKMLGYDVNKIQLVPQKWQD